MRAFILALLLGCIAVGTNAVSCNTIPTGGSPDFYASSCAAVLGYTTALGSVASCSAPSESAMTIFSLYGGNLSPACASSLAQYLCVTFYPPCTQIPPQAPPSSTCQNIAQNCTGTDLSIMAVIQGVYQGNPSTSATFKNFSYCSATSTATFSAASTALTMSLAQLKISSTATYTGTACKGVVNYPIFVKQSSPTQIPLAEQLVSGLIPSLAGVPTACRDNFYTMMCQYAFPQAYTTSASPLFGVGIVPAAPSQTLCQLVNSLTAGCGLNPNGTAWTYQVTQAIAASLAAEGVTGISIDFFNCSAQTATGPSCPAGTFTYSPSYYAGSYVNGLGVSVPAISAPSSVSTPVTCNAPLVIPNGGGPTIADSSCALPCPSLLWDQGQYKESDVTMITLSCISLVCSSAMLGTYTAFKKTRRKYSAIMFTFFLWIVSICLFFTVAVTNDKNNLGIFAGMQCKDNSQGRYEGYCVWQAVAMVIGGFGAVCWWCIQSIDLFLQLLFNANKWPESRRFYLNVMYMSWGIGWPAVIVIIAGGMGKLGSQLNGIPYCFIIDTDLTYALFYGPIIAMCVIGVTCMVVIIVVIFRSSEASGAHKKKGGYLIYIRPLIFIGAFLFVWVFIFAYRFYEEANFNNFINEANTYVQCLLFLKPAGVATACNVYPVDNSGLYFMIQVVVSGVGLWGFLLYNTWENFVMWWHFITCKAYNFSRTTGTEETSQNSQKQQQLSKQGSKKQLKSGPSSGHIKTNTTSSDDGMGLRYGGATSPTAGSSTADTTDVDPRFSSAGIPATGSQDAIPRTQTGLELGTVQ